MNDWNIVDSNSIKKNNNNNNKKNFVDDGVEKTENFAILLMFYLFFILCTVYCRYIIYLFL
jgi:hypothetical protein